MLEFQFDRGIVANASLQNQHADLAGAERSVVESVRYFDHIWLSWES